VTDFTQQALSDRANAARSRVLAKLDYANLHQEELVQCPTNGDRFDRAHEASRRARMKTKPFALLQASIRAVSIHSPTRSWPRREAAVLHWSRPTASSRPPPEDISAEGLGGIKNDFEVVCRDEVARTAANILVSTIRHADTSADAAAQ
jgi:hypothetical protein